MTNSERNLGLERIIELKNRNQELNALINRYEPSTNMEEMLLEIVKENQTSIDRLEKSTSARYEFLFNFESGGWNSEYAYTKEEAQQLANEKYCNSTSKPDMKTFRVSTPNDYQNLLSMFN